MMGGRRARRVGGRRASFRWAGDRLGQGGGIVPPAGPQRSFRRGRVAKPLGGPRVAWRPLRGESPNGGNDDYKDLGDHCGSGSRGRDARRPGRERSAVIPEIVVPPVTSRSRERAGIGAWWLRDLTHQPGLFLTYLPGLYQKLRCPQLFVRSVPPVRTTRRSRAPIIVFQQT